MLSSFRGSICCSICPFIRTAVLLTCVLSLVSDSAFAAEPPGQKYTYKTVDGINLSIYVTRPADWQPTDQRPAILFFHGGGWVGGAPGQFTRHAQYFASRGLVCFQAQYRLLDRKSDAPPTICIQDARSAMRWVRSRAKEFGIDPNRIASAGGSAGGHLAATLGTIDQHDEPGEPTETSVVPNAMILFNPVYDNGPKGWGSGRVKDRYRDFSPAHNISTDTPPAIVFLGDEDKLIPVATAEAFQEKMKAQGVHSELVIFPGMGHGFFNYGRHDNQPYLKTVRAADRFLASLGWLQGEPTVKPAEIEQKQN